jgi:hypothetical protein
MTALQRTTGRDRPEWFGILDNWGAAGRPYHEIADWLTGEQGLSAWWAQKLVVEYEQARGIRAPGIRSDGTFTVGASKAIGAPLERLVEACVDPALRARWMPDIAFDVTTLKPSRSLRGKLADGHQRLSVTFAEISATKSQVAVEHERLPDARAAQRARAFWRERLSVLKALLEASKDREDVDV